LRQAPYHIPELKRANQEEVCGDCKFISYCNGGCTAEAYYAGNVVGKAPVTCSFNKVVFEEILKVLKKENMPIYKGEKK
jgi:sulfatase maturation enzyme AslB (radical SAM superfamily)